MCLNLRRLLPRTLIRESRAVEQHIREGRFQRSLALITAFASLLSGWEVATEHYRGSYNQRLMYSPVLLTPVLMLAALWGALSRRAARTALPFVSVVVILNGLIGFFWHVRGVARKPGGWRIPVFTVTMGPPVLAPLLFALSGYLGLLTSFLRQEDAPKQRLPANLPRWGHGRRWLPRALTREGKTLEQEIREGRFQRHLAASAAIAGLCSGFEALYSHYRNNFAYKVQWTPILLTPLLAFAGFGAIWSRWLGRTLLPLVSLLAILNGSIGAFYHVRAQWRSPGGIKFLLINPRQGIVYRLTYGPPPFAPLLFAASGFLGLLASLMQRER
jgi:hypothetical protein